MTESVDESGIETLDYVLSVPELDALRDRVDFGRHKVEVSVSHFS